jgi:hypothetical protein
LYRESQKEGKDSTDLFIPAPSKVSPIEPDFIYEAKIDHSKPSKYHARKDNHPTLTLPEIDELEYTQLVNEIKETMLGIEAIFVRYDNKLVLFYDKGDVELFEEIMNFKKSSPLHSSDMAMTKYVQWEHSDVFVDILYEQNFQSCMTFERGEDPIVHDMRTKFLLELLKKNLFLVMEISVYDPKQRFVLVYSSFETNAREAERLQFRFQLTEECIKRHIPAFCESHQDLKTPSFWGRSTSTKFAMSFYNTKETSVHKRSVPFVFSAIADYKGGNVETLGHRRVKEHFFSPENRNQLLHSIVSSCHLGIKYHNSKRMTIIELLDCKVFSGYFALHDDSVHRVTADMKEPPKLVATKLGLKMWAERISFSKLPLSSIRTYFGESIGFYFGWLEFYTIWFGYLAVIGVISFIYGIVALAYQRARAITIFDNEATPVFAFLINVWSLLFLKFWKRKAHYLSFLWDMDNFEKLEQRRIQHVTSAQRISAITGKKEDYEPVNKARARKLIAGIIMLIAFAILCAMIAGNIALFGFLDSVDSLSSTASIITSSLFAVFQILIVAPIYNQLTLFLNNFENYLTNTAYLSIGY